ncbi:MAG: hypothetical protein ABR964_06730 [Tepidisphaeraceae bacterium]|jgi:hypothetical protein
MTSEPEQRYVPQHPLRWLPEIKTLVSRRLQPFSSPGNPNFFHLRRNFLSGTF